MSDLIMQLAGVMQRDIDSLRAVSDNVANANTPGYRASRTFNALESPIATQLPEVGLGGIRPVTSIDTRNGALQRTDRVTDLALDGDGWFGLQTPDGAMLTRDGRFHVDNAGYLVASNGYPVMGEDGPISVAGGKLRVDQGGAVFVDEQPVGRLAIVRVEDPQSLDASGAGLFYPSTPLLPASQYHVFQGMLERSNSVLSEDMVRMMEVSRHVESMQRALSAYNGLLDSGINQLGKD